MKPVFIHISKNAGTSVVSSAREHIVVAGHRTAASWVADHGRTGSIFAIIRDPYARVASEYLYRRRRFDGGEKNPHLANLAKPFGDWVIDTYGGDAFRTKAFFERTGVHYNDFNMIDDMLIWFIPQNRWLCGEDGELLTDELLRLETLEDDWRAFSTRHGFECELIHTNGAPSTADIWGDRRQELRDVIYDFYREDFEIFGYDR